MGKIKVPTRCHHLLPVTRLADTRDDDRWDVLLNSVLDSGINFVYTANDYGLHWARPAEEQIGRHLSGRRSEFYLASEGGDTPFPPFNTRKFLASSTAGFPAGSTFMGPPFPPLASLSQILSSYPSGAY